MIRILVTGAGGVGGVNFVRAIRAMGESFVVGTDFFEYHLQFPNVDKSYSSPRHSDPTFMEKIGHIVKSDKIDFVHPQPEMEALVVARHREELVCKTFLPAEAAYLKGQDKITTAHTMAARSVTAPRTLAISGPDDVASAFKEFAGKPVWVRSRFGAGGKQSLLCRSEREAILWMRLWVERGEAQWEHFALQEYLPGRNIAWDSLWFQGRLVTSFSRERLEYIFPNVSPSGITGTPVVSRTISDGRVDEAGEAAVRAIDQRPHGFYSVDMKENAESIPCITEVNVGKFHTTAPLWSYAAVTGLKQPWFANLSYLYTRIGIEGKLPDEKIPAHDLLPKDVYLLRHIDCGALLWKKDGWKFRLL